MVESLIENIKLNMARQPNYCQCSVSGSALFNADCMDILPLIPDKSVQLIIIDPPYFEVKGDFDFVFENENKYLEFIEMVIVESKRVLTQNGSLFLYCSQEMGAYIDLILRKYFTIKNRLIWYRSGGISPRKKFKVSHEPLFYCVNDINNHTWNLDDIRVKSIYADKDKRLNPLGKSPDDVWYIPNLVGKKAEKVDHPTQKPLEICDRIIKCSTNESDIVLIPFAGSGSELVKLKELNRKFIGIEKEVKYYELAVGRVFGQHCH